jgi:hypothetical protein
MYKNYKNALANFKFFYDLYFIHFSVRCVLMTQRPSETKKFKVYMRSKVRGFVGR